MSVKLHFACVAALALVLCDSQSRATAQTPPDDWRPGDLFVGIGRPATPEAGQYRVFSDALAAKETIDAGGGYTTGCAVDPVTGRFWTTHFDRPFVSILDRTHPHATVQAIDARRQTEGGAVESVVFGPRSSIRRYAMVGTVDGNNRVLRYTPDGTFDGYVAPAETSRGTDWIDLTRDGRRIYYTSEDSKVRVMDAETGALEQAHDLSQYGGTLYGIRLLPPGDGVTGGFLVAGSNGVDRYDGSGRFVQRYMLPDQLGYFAISLSPDAQHVWVATGERRIPSKTGDVVYPAMIGKIHLPTGDVVAGPIQSPSGEVSGLCVESEYMAAASENTCLRMDASGALLLDANGTPIVEDCRAVEACKAAGDQDGDGLDDATDPDCAPRVQPPVTPICTGTQPVPDIWPPSSRLVAVRLEGVRGPRGEAVSVSVTGIYQDEPTETAGDGNTPVDAEIRDGVAYVRAERSRDSRQGANGRVYHVDFTAIDAGGGHCSGTLQVGVPADGGQSRVVDDGRRYNSLTGLPVP